ncbi:Fiber protein Fb17 [Gossypium australe]|uniref:Fiber protein Fb17 n=1 Tax=Gossypium australe TaxID=47621 RepID=A0A5B6X8Y2_9ROSI|nr:Fiber protein Fb17 [Gossypium australe]
MSPYYIEKLRLHEELFGDYMFSNNATNFELDPDSRGQPDDTVPDGVGNPNANELSKQFNSRDNSQRDVEGGVVCIEPDPKHLDHAGQASNGRIHKGDEARMTPVGNANSQIDKGRTPCSGCNEKKPCSGCNEKKRKNRQTPEWEKAQKRIKKQAADRQYRADRKELEAKYGEIEKLESILEKFVDIEADSNKLSQIKSMLGINEAEIIVDKLKGMEDELQKLDQIKSLFGGIDEIEPAINRLKTMGLQLEKQKQMVSQKEVEPFQASPGSLLVSDQCGFNLNSFSTVSGTAPTMQYFDGLVDCLIAQITDENIPSDLDTNSFGDLLGGARESVGKYEIPSSLVSTARHVFEVHAIKEMDNVFLEDVNEGIIWKLRHQIMDAKRSEFDTEFAMKRLTTIVHGYFGLKARQDQHNLEQWVARLRADEETLRKELEKKSQEIQDTEAKLRRLTSDKCKFCKESTENFGVKGVHIF